MFNIQLVIKTNKQTNKKNKELIKKKEEEK